MKNLIVLIIVCAFSMDVFAQSKIGMHQKDGTWLKPTPQSALVAFEEDKKDYKYAVAVLRQTYDQWPATELDALANELGRIFVEGTLSESVQAGLALQFSAWQSNDGTPYLKSRNVFMRIYESVADTNYALGVRALTAALNSHGEDYVRDLFRESKKPEKACLKSMRVWNRNGTRIDPKTRCPYRHEPWCVAGYVLANNRMSKAQRVNPLFSDPTLDDILPYCYGQVKEGDKWPLVVY